DHHLVVLHEVTDEHEDLRHDCLLIGGEMGEKRKAAPAEASAALSNHSPPGRSRDGWGWARGGGKGVAGGRCLAPRSTALAPKASPIHPHLPPPTNTPICP